MPSVGQVTRNNPAAHSWGPSPTDTARRHRGPKIFCSRIPPARQCLSEALYLLETRHRSRRATLWKGHLFTVRHLVVRGGKKAFFVVGVSWLNNFAVRRLIPWACRAIVARATSGYLTEGYIHRFDSQNRRWHRVRCVSIYSCESFSSFRSNIYLGDRTAYTAASQCAKQRREANA